MLSASARRFAGRSLSVLRRSNVMKQPQQQQLQLQRRTMAEMPVPQSSKAVLFEGHPTNEGWESSVAWWYSTSFVLICLIMTTTPATDIEGWAQKEAAARLQLKEQNPDMEFKFGTHYQDVLKDQRKDGWDNFSLKSVKMTDDDDDDEDEDDEEEDDE